MTKYKILLVDDEANVLKSLKRLFMDADYKIFTAASGDEGLEICSREEIALVISDYRMPRMNGVQFLSRVREQYPQSIRIILSGYADVSAIVESINDGQIYKFLSKPWNDQDLLTTIQRSFEHYRLQEEHDGLLGELKCANEELKKLTNSLEEKVDDRTRVLGHKHRALETSQRLLNLLPAGVIGIDGLGTVVYLNNAMESLVDAQQLKLGEPLPEFSEFKSLALLLQANEKQETISSMEEEVGGMRVVCTPLPDQAGVVGLFCPSGQPAVTAETAVTRQPESSDVS